MLVEYKAIDFLGGMLAKATGAASVNKVLKENQGWNPVLFCDGPHMLGPVLILARRPPTSPPSLIARKVTKETPEFVCSDCGGDISGDDKICPHCGAAIEGE